MFREELQRFLRRAGDSGVVAQQLQQLADGLGGIEIVVDQQQAQTLVSRSLLIFASVIVTGERRDAEYLPDLDRKSVV